MPLLPEKISERAVLANPDGTEKVPAAKAGADYYVSLSTFKKGRGYLTIGKTGSGADYECDGVDDHVQIQAALDAAAAGTNGAPANILIIGYSYAFQYNFGDVVTIKSVVGGQAIHIYADNAVLRNQNGYSGEKFITQNFYTEINQNYNSYSTIGGFYMTGGILEGNSGGGTMKTFTYANLAAFPATGNTTRLYVARDTDTGYYWNGSSYTTTGIADSGKHWRAYAYHQMKIYGFHYVLDDVQFYDSLEFVLYSEQTNTDTNVFNDYATMEAILRHISIVGYNLGAINWLGPHDSTWYDIGPHTNQYAVPTVLHNIYIGSGANFNGGGLTVHNLHPWGNTATYGVNCLLDHSSIRGEAYIEGSTNNVGLRAISSTMSLILVVTNTKTAVELTDCFNVRLDVDNYYQFVSLQLMFKVIGMLNNSQIRVWNVDGSNMSGTPTLFDISAITTATSHNNLFLARIPYFSATVTPGFDHTTTLLDATNEIDFVQIGSTPALTKVYKRMRSVQARVSSAASASTLTPDTNLYDLYRFTALAANLTINNNPTSGSSTPPSDQDMLRIRITDNGTGRTLTFGTAYVAKAGIALPTTTTANKLMRMTFEYDSSLAKWNLVALTQEA